MTIERCDAIASITGGVEKRRPPSLPKPHPSTNCFAGRYIFKQLVGSNATTVIFAEAQLPHMRQGAVLVEIGVLLKGIG